MSTPHVSNTLFIEIIANSQVFDIGDDTYRIAHHDGAFALTCNGEHVCDGDSWTELETAAREHAAERYLKKYGERP